MELESKTRLALLILYCNGGEMAIKDHKAEYFQSIEKFGSVEKALEHYEHQVKFLPSPHISKLGD